MFEGEIVRRISRPASVVFPWLLWVESFPRWFVLCHEAQHIGGEPEAEGSVYKLGVNLGGLLRKVVRMKIVDLDEDAMSYRFVRDEDGNQVEMRFAAAPDGGASAGATQVSFFARYEGSGRILGVPVGSGLFVRIIERALDRSLPRLDKLIAAEEGG